MKLALVTLGLGFAQLLGLAAAACPSVAIKTRGRVVVGKNTTLTVKVSNAWNKGQTAVTDGILTVGLCMDRSCLTTFFALARVPALDELSVNLPGLSTHGRLLSTSLALSCIHPCR